MMSGSRVTVRTVDLSTGYIAGGGHRSVVAEGLNTELRSCELTCLLGRNGAGKSTLLKTLSAFQPPLSGDIIIEGKSIDDYSENELARIIGVVLTDRITLSNITVRELIAMGRSPYTGFWGTLSQHDRDVVEEAILQVGIAPLAERAVLTLSDGERQKAMIAKALAQETPVIFLDEPTAFLDYPSKVEIMMLLQRLTRVGDKTVFMSTHDLELALQIADSLWLVDKDKGFVTGTPRELACNGEIARYFQQPGIKFDPVTATFRVDRSDLK